MEAELTVLAMLLLEVIERGHYEVDVYTDCGELLPYMKPCRSLSDRPVLRRLLELERCRALVRRAHAKGGKVVLRQLRRGWNKRADTLCNQAMNNTRRLLERCNSAFARRCCGWVKKTSF